MESVPDAQRREVAFAAFLERRCAYRKGHTMKKSLAILAAIVFSIAMATALAGCGGGSSSGSSAASSAAGSAATASSSAAGSAATAGSAASSAASAASASANAASASAGAAADSRGGSLITVDGVDVNSVALEMVGNTPNFQIVLANNTDNDVEFDLSQFKIMVDDADEVDFHLTKTTVKANTPYLQRAETASEGTMKVGDSATIYYGDTLLGTFEVGEF